MPTERPGLPPQLHQGAATQVLQMSPKPSTGGRDARGQPQSVESVSITVPSNDSFRNHAASNDSFRSHETLVKTPEEPGSPSKPQTGKPDAMSRIGIISLWLLVFQNTTLTITMRASRLPGTKTSMYLPTSAVFLCELLKLIVSIIALCWQKHGIFGAMASIHKDILSSFSSNALLLIPSVLYALQNNLQYYAAGHLDPATFQVLYQMKLITTAFLSVLLLGRQLSVVQWSSVVILTIGIILVQTDNMAVKKGQTNETEVAGFFAVLVACCTSASAGVFLEKLVKETAPSVWIRNIQLAVFGLIVGAFACYYKDYDAIMKDGFLQGFDSMVWVVVIMQSCGGILVAVVLKYADNIVKGFATGLSIILSAAAATVMFHTSLTMQYCAGATVVVISVYLYSTNAIPGFVKRCAGRPPSDSPA